MYHTAPGWRPLQRTDAPVSRRQVVGEEACSGLLARNKIWFKPSAAPGLRRKRPSVSCQSLPSVPTRLPLSTKMQSPSILTVPTVPLTEQLF
jgi:hypothetical protein